MRFVTIGRALLASSLLLIAACNVVTVTPGTDTSINPPPGVANDTTAPSVPANLAATALSAASVQLTWSASHDNEGGSGLANYQVLRDGVQIAQAPVGTLSYTDTGLTASTLYSFAVRAVDKAGNISVDSNTATATTPASTNADSTPPSVPQNLVATAPSSTSVHLTWAASTDNAGGSGLASYRLMRGGMQIAQVPAGTLSYTETGLTGNTPYAYTVRAADNAGNMSADSNTATVTTPPATTGDTTAPSVPSNLVAAAQSSNSVRLTWGASADNAGGSGLATYRVVRGGVQVAQVPAGTLTFTETGLSASSTYSYTVRAVDNAGNVSADSNTAVVTMPASTGGDTTAPSVPQNLVATARTSSSISLSWSASTDNAGGSGLASYRVLRGTVQVAQIPAGTVTYIDTGLSASTLYSYTVRAVDVAGNSSANSNTASATTLSTSAGDTTPPTVPANLIATAATSKSIRLSWSASTDNAGGSGLAAYRVLRGGVQVAQVPAGTLSFTETGLAANTRYTYTVRAADNAGNMSADSNSASATTLPAPLTGMSRRPSNPTCIAPVRPGSGSGNGTLALSVQPAFPGLTFSNLSGAFQAPGDASRWFVTELDGHILTFANNNNAKKSNLFLDISNRVITGGELGLFGIAFHPDFPGDPRAYVSYTTYVNGLLQSRISQFKSTDRGKTLDPASETVLVTVDQPANNHNGGFIAFGPDRLLYFGLGDGGGEGDPWGPIGNGQNTQTLLSKILRIDISAPNGAVPYRIPSSNPFSGNTACNVNGTSTANCPEIFAWGLRNPWKGSFDRQTGQLWIGDVGQNSWEEADRVNLGGNYGWRCREGANVYNSNCGPAKNLIDPVVQFANVGGSSITGGYVYRGRAYPALVGQFVFADFIRGLFTVDSNATPTVTATNLTPLAGINVVAFAEDQAGELMVVDYSGKLYNLLVSGGTGTNTIPDKLSATGCADASNPMLPSAGLIPYVPNAAFWSDGAAKKRWLGLPDGLTITPSASSGDWSFPLGTILRKDFALGNQLIETRLLMRHPDGVWAGYTYHWDAAQTEATRVSNGLDVNVAGQTWHIPSETECMRCHTQAAGYSLGLETGQENGSLAYPSAPSPPFNGNTANQLFTLNSIGLFNPAISADPATLPAYPDPYGNASTIADRARTYLHTNCSQCHRPGGGTPVNLDLRYQTTMAATNTCGATPADNLGIAGAAVISPANPDASILFVRMSQRGANQMPPIATNLVDTLGVALLRAWISGMNSACQ